MNYEQIITAIFSDDQSLSKSNLETFKNIKVDDVHYTNLLNLIKTSSDQRIVKFAALTLSSSITTVTEEYKQWFGLQTETQNAIKTGLVEALDNTKDKTTGRILTSVTVGLSCMIFSAFQELDIPFEGNEFDLRPKVVEYVSSGDELKILLALWILGDVFENMEEDFTEEFKTVHQQSKLFLQHFNLDIQLACVNVIGTFLTQVSEKKMKKFNEFIPTCLKIIYQGIEAGDKQREIAFDTLHFIIQNTPNFFKDHIKQLLELTVNAQKLKLSIIDKQSNLLTMVTFCEAFSEGVENDPDMIKSILNLILSYMKTAEPEADDAWHSIVELNISDTEVGFCSHLIQRLLECLGEDIIIPILSQLLLELAKSTDWKSQYAALIEFGYLGPTVQEIDSLDPLIGLVIKLFGSKNPKIRFAALHSIIQLSSDLAPEFQSKFYKVLFKDMTALLKDESARVVSACFGAVGSFLEGLKQATAVKATELIFRELMLNLSKGTTAVKIAALSCIGAVAKGTGAEFKMAFDQGVELVFENLARKDEPRLRLGAFEAITMIGDAVGTELFAKISDKSIEAGLEILENSGAGDKNLHFVYSGWQRLAIVAKEQVTKNFEKIMEKFLPLIEAEAKNIKEDLDEPFNMEDIVETAKGNEKKSELVSHTTSMVSIKCAILMLHTFAEHITKEFSTYIPKFIPLLVPLLNHKNAEEVGIPAGECLKGLLKALTKSENADVNISSQVFPVIDGILKQISDTPESDVIAENIEFLREIFDENKFSLDPDHMKLLTAAIVEQINMNLDNRVESCESFGEEDEEPAQKLPKDDKKKGKDINKTCGVTKKNSPVEDEDEEEILDDDDEEFNELDELLVGLAELVSSIVKNQKDKAIEMLNTIFNTFAGNLLIESATPGMKKFMIFIIDESLVSVSIDTLSSLAPQMAEILFKYGTDLDYSVRQAAVFGIGILAWKSGDYFNMIKDQCFKVIESSLNLEKNPNGDDELYGNFRDNAVASIGKIIKHQSKNLQNLDEVIDEWIQKLPLKYDTEEAYEQHDILIDLIEKSENHEFLKRDGRLKEILRVFAEIKNGKMIKSESGPKINAILKVVKDNEAYKTVYESIDESLKKKLALDKL